jgi:hypothetical protein
MEPDPYAKKNFSRVLQNGILEEESKNHHSGGFDYKSGREDFRIPPVGRTTDAPSNLPQNPKKRDFRGGIKKPPITVVYYKSGREDFGIPSMGRTTDTPSNLPQNPKKSGF